VAGATVQHLKTHWQFWTGVGTFSGATLGAMYGVFRPFTEVQVKLAVLETTAEHLKTDVGRLELKLDTAKVDIMAEVKKGEVKMDDLGKKMDDLGKNLGDKLDNLNDRMDQKVDQKVDKFTLAVVGGGVLTGGVLTGVVLLAALSVPKK
jgi:hypothetical protein